jgi:hypothetical protein
MYLLTPKISMPDDERGRAHAQALADQVRQPFAGDDAEPRAHFLDEDQGEGDQHQHPQEGIAIVSARDRVGRDAARVVIYVGGNDAGTDDG